MMKLVFAYLALLMLFVACTSNTTTAANAQTNASETAQQNANENSAVQETAAQKEFEGLFAKRNLQWKIAYDLKSDANGEKTASQMTEYMKGADRFRIDMTYEGNEVRSYMVDGTYTTCTKNSGSWQCYKMSSSNESNVPAEDFEKEYEQNQTDYSILADGTKVIAGVTTKCFKVKQVTDQQAVVRYCFSSDGAPLYLYTEYEGGSSEMTATSYSKTVSDSEFTPPAKAQDISAMYGGTGGTSPAGGNSCDYCNYLSGSDKENCLASC